jgi:class 3 adenylate cyclase
MAETSNIRRLAAILAADVVDYSRLMHEDEAGTVAAWQAARRDAIDPTLEANKGRVVKRTGDGFLAEFATVEDAVKCAVAMQGLLADGPLDFRMGINLGDITDDGDDIHGDGVNIAARLEGLADPGGICISGSVHDQVHNKLDLSFTDTGEREVKNIARPVRVFKINLGKTKTAPDASATSSRWPVRLGALDHPGGAGLGREDALPAARKAVNCRFALRQFEWRSEPRIFLGRDDREHHHCVVQDPAHVRDRPKLDIHL